MEQEECRSVCVCVGGVIGVIKRMCDGILFFPFTHETLNPTLFFVSFFVGEKSLHILPPIKRRALFKALSIIRHDIIVASKKGRRCCL